MARAGKALQNATPSHKRNNTRGYTQRFGRKFKKPHSFNSHHMDVYEYQPDEVRRANVSLSFNKEEERRLQNSVIGDQDSDEIAYGAQNSLPARLIGETVEDEGVDSEDDEEIDSDAAFEESDEERFAGFNFARTNKAAKGGPTKKVRKETFESKATGNVRLADVNLDEESVEEKGEMNDDGENDSSVEMDNGDSSGFINLVDVLDGKGEVYIPSDGRDDSGQPNNFASADVEKSAENDGMEDGDDESSGELSEEEDHVIEASEDEQEGSSSALDALHSFVSNLNSTIPSTAKRKSTDADEDPVPPPRRRRLMEECTEVGPENEFGVPRSSGPKLSLDDLLAPLSNQPPSTVLSLQRSTKALRPLYADPDATTISKLKKRPQTLLAPLPQRAQERLDREAAYEQTKQEVNKWSTTMKRIREAEHLSFPLQAESSGKVSNLQLAAKFKPTTPMESSIDALLRTAKIREKDIEKTEDVMLQTNQVTMEEVAQRRAELRKVRELMFRAEVRAKRMKKIKSKVYRRLKRKEREKAGTAASDGDEVDGEKRMKLEVERARERATLRHKNTGKWAKAMKGMEGLGDDQRRAIEEMLERSETLTRKIHGKDSDDDSGSEADGPDEGSDLDKVRAGAFNELARLDEEEVDGGIEGKSIFEMKFMKDAMARVQHRVDRERDDFIQELGDQDLNGSGDEQAREDEGAVAVQRTGGRVVIRPGIGSLQSEPESSQPPPNRVLLSLASDTSSVTLKSTDVTTSFPIEPEQPRPTTVSSTIPEVSNPWLTPRYPDGSSPLKAHRKKNEVVVAKDSSGAEKSKNKLKKQSRKREGENTKAVEDAEVEISMDNVLTSSTQAERVNMTDTRHGSASAVQGENKDNGSDSDVHSEVEEQEKLSHRKDKGKSNGPRAFEQRDLVTLAFAGDNVVQDFEMVKQREMAADAPREIDTTLPGWGSWGGAGIKKHPAKPQQIKKIAGIDPKTRADYMKKNIIISEKKDKKAAKYLVKDLPYPYTSRAQFERAMETPIGTEWNTRIGFQKATLPKVVKKMGAIIDPLEKLF